MNKNKTFLCILLVVVNLLIILHVNNSWNNYTKEIIPQEKILIKLKNDIILSHLWLEELINHSDKINIQEQILTPLLNKDFKQNFKIKTNENIYIFKQIKIINQKVNLLYEKATQRINKYHKLKRIGTSQKDEDYDILFKELISIISDTISMVNKNNQILLKKEKSNFSFVLILFFIFNTMIVIFLIYMQKKSNQIIKMMHEQSKLAAMGEMLLNIAHQWRQPLSLITVSASGMKLQKDLNILSDDFFDSSIEHINKSAHYLSQTIDDFRNFVLGERKKSLYNLNETIENSLSLIDSSIKNHNIEMVLNLTDEIIINGYSNELSQCLINILNNAKDELNKFDSIRLIIIETKLKKDKVIITITDNAGGIPKKVLPRIFDMYFTTKLDSHGTGLGLSMTKTFINSMDGDIQVDNKRFSYKNEYYKGAQFKITIPIEDKA